MSPDPRFRPSKEVIEEVVRVEFRERIGRVVDFDRRIVSGIIYVIKHGLMWRDAPKDYGPHKTVYNRFIRWSRLGVFNRIFAELAGKAGEPERIMIDATHLKAHRTAASLLKGGLFPDVSGAPKAG